MKTSLRLPHAVLVAVLVVGAVVVLFPFWIALLMAFKSAKETFDSFYGLPTTLRFDNFVAVWETSRYPASFLNSVIVTLGSTALIIVVSALAGYSVARRPGRFYQFFYVLFLAGMMVPFQIIMLPTYQIGKSLHLIDTFVGLILLYGGGGIQTGILFYAGFIRTIPKELEEAATLDGYGLPSIVARVIMPLLKPVTATVAVINILYIWNDFLLPLLFLQKAAVRTIPLQQYFFFGQYSSDLNLAFAFAVLGILPVLVFFLAMQRYIIGGIVAGAVKG